MKIQRSRNAVRNIFWGFMSKIVSLLFPFIIRTIIIKELGSEYLGLSSLFSSILTVLNIGELGISSAIVFSMYKPIAEDDQETICALMNFYKKTYRVIGTAVLAVGLIVMPFLPRFISGSYPDDINLYLLYGLYLASTVAGYFLFAYRNCLLNAYQRNDVINKLSIITSILQYGAQIIALVIYHNYYIYVGLMIITQIINNVWCAHEASVLFPQYKAVGKVDDRLVLDIRKQIGGLALNKVTYVTRNTFDSIFLSMFLGLTTVTIYSNYYYIINALIALFAIVTTSIKAGIGNSIVCESEAKNYRDMRMFVFIFAWLSGFCSICLACLYQPFMKIWVGNELMFPNYMAVTFAIYFYVMMMNSVIGNYLDACGLWWKAKGRTIMELVLNIILNYFLGLTLGAFGIVLATIITALFVNFGLGSRIVFKYYFVSYKTRDFYFLHMKYLVVTVLSGTATYAICSAVGGAGIFSFVLKCLVCIVVPNILFVLCYFKEDDFLNSKKLLLNLMNLRNNRR